ncbi:MAG: winged helix-turn-helix domain-containing protein [Bacteroidetes bacterium]|nr:winged helix-turn-helix domain-containing protein [Bacteroidota bacterium]MDA1333001.1 winged helix-turn-helix domain-containing protein [Bacteroidota bacterium]
MVQKTAIIDLEKTFLLGDVLVEPMLNRISQGPCSVHVERQVMLLLVHLAKHSNEPVTREALYRAVWTQSEPNDEALTQAISKLRKALTDVGAEKGIVETIRKVGYRVTADVQSVQSPRKVASQGPLSRAAAPPATQHRKNKKVVGWASAIAIVLFVLSNKVSIQSHHLASDPDVKVVRITLDADRQGDGSEWITDEVPEEVVASMPEHVSGALAFVHRSKTSGANESRSSIQNNEPTIERD